MITAPTASIAPNAKRVPLTCGICSTPITSGHVCEDCQVLYVSHLAECECCGALYVLAGRKQKYGSRACARKAARTQEKANRQEMMQADRQNNGSKGWAPVEPGDYNAPAVLWACVQPPSLVLMNCTQVMTDPEYRQALNSGALEGRYVERWGWKAESSHVYQVTRGVAVYVREVRE